MAAFHVLRGEGGDEEIRRVAGMLQVFVREQWQALKHRMDMQKFALLFRLPFPDVEFWLQSNLGDDSAFWLYEQCGPVMQRLLILEAMEDCTSEQIRIRCHAVCAICGIELFPTGESSLRISSD